MRYEEYREEQSLKYAHSALIDYQKFLRMWSENKLDEIRLVTNINKELEDLNQTLLDLEEVFPYLDIDNQNLN